MFNNLFGKTNQTNSLRANIYRLAVVRPSPEVELLKTYHHSLVELNDSFISFDKSGKKEKYPLTFVSEDFSNRQYKGKFSNGTAFRVLVPYGMSLDLKKSQLNCKAAFSIGSEDTNGYGVFFALTSPNDLRDYQVEIGNKDEHLKRVLEGAVMAFQAGLQEKFFDMTKDILHLVEDNPGKLNQYEIGRLLVQNYRTNRQYYDFKEQQIISKF